MYDIINQIIGHTWQTGNNEQQYIMYTCCALVLILTVAFIDSIKAAFASFMTIKK